MKTHWIEIDENIWKYLQKKAEPFIDTPNTVLRRLFFGDEEDLGFSPPISVNGLPTVLSHILEILYEVDRHGYSRSQATRIVANRKGATSRIIVNKYCKQLGKKAREIDQLLKEPGYREFKQILKNKFSKFKDVIEIYFETLLCGNV